ncbi:MAG: aspartate/glutamate racemase family protein [Pseudomonadota bacterium]
MHIGLIGGIGVAATLAYYQRLTAAIQSAGAVPDITIVHADAATLLANNRTDDRTAQAKIYCALIDRLAAAGAECAAITSLGGHFCFAETKAMSALPLVSGIEALNDAAHAMGMAKLGLLGTQSAMHTQLYGLLQSPAIVPEDVAGLGRAYEDMALRGAATEADTALFFAAGQGLMDAGAEVVVLAGTDLGLVFDHAEVPYPVLDALDAHVAKLANLATDRTPLAH